MPLQYVVSPKAGAIYWSLRKDATAPSLTHKRLYQNWYVYGRGKKVFVWQSVNAAAGGGSVFNPYFYRQHIAGGMHGESA